MTDLWHASLTRRELIRLGLVGLAAPYLPLKPAAPWSFVVFSDTHFGVGDNLALNRALLEEIAALEPALVLNAGDVTERGWAEEYDDADRAFAGLDLTVHHAPGNHEVRWAPLGLQIFAERAGPPHRIVEHGGCVFAQLDSTVPLSHWGHIGGPQRRWLERELARYGDAPVFVFLHHHAGAKTAALRDATAARAAARDAGRGHPRRGHPRRGHARRGHAAGSDRLRRRADAGVDARSVRRRDVAPAAPRRHAVPEPDGWQRAGAGHRRWRGTLALHDRRLLPFQSGARGRHAHRRQPDADVYALDARSGALRWRFATRAPVFASAAVAHDVVAIGSGDGSIYGIDLAAGTLRWQFRLPPGPSAFAQSPAATDGQRFFIGAWDRNVYALDARTGAEQWRHLATPSTFYYSAAIAAPALAHGRLYVPSNDRVLHALDATTGDVVWQQSSGGDKFGYSSPLVVGDRIFIGCLGDRGEVRCVAADDGRELWVAATGATIYESSPALVGDDIAIGSVNGTLWLLAGTDGRILGQYRLPPGHFISSPAAAPGRVYAATFAEVVTALDVRR